MRLIRQDLDQQKASGVAQRSPIPLEPAGVWVEAREQIRAGRIPPATRTVQQVKLLSQQVKEPGDE